MSEMRNYLAIDCGNSSIRIVCGSFDGENLETRLIHQVANEPICVNGLFFWDILGLFRELQRGVRKTAREVGEIASIGISTWGIDFALVGASGQMLSNPLCYRNSLGAKVLSRLSEDEKAMLFEETGICEHPMNTLYQLLGIREFLPELYEKAERLLLIPDLFAWMLTGAMRSESSIASTTQMRDMRSGAYSKTVLDYFGLSRSLFPAPIPHGEVYGLLSPDLAASLGVPSCPIVCVPSHDTAAAVVSVPAEGGRFAFISSGTWFLVGTEIEAALVSPEVRAAGFTNEGGVFNTITLLKNSAGMFILQNIKAELEAEGRELSWEEMVTMAKAYKGKVPLFDPNHPDFFKPASMIEAIRRHLAKHVPEASEREGAQALIVASAYQSLAWSYRMAVTDLERLTGTEFDKVHIVGGGCRNAYLNQITADLLGKTVTAGPDEATSLGTIGIQIMREQPGMRLSDLRALLKSVTTVNEYLPRQVSG